MVDVKPLPLPSASNFNCNDDDDDNILYAWDLPSALAANMEALSSDEELLDFGSHHTRLVLNSSSDEELIDVTMADVQQQQYQQQQQHSDSNKDSTKCSRCRKCLRIFSNHTGLFYAFISSIFFAITTIFVKMLTDKVNSAEILFWRFLITLILIIPPLVYVRPTILVTKKQFVLLVLRALFGATAIGLLYSACQRIAVGDANAIFFCNPIFTVVFACILLKEGCSIWDVILSLLSICGVFLVTRPPLIFHPTSDKETSQNNPILGALLALAGALFAAVTFVTLRKIGKSVHYLTTIFYYSAFTLILTAILISAMRWWKLPNCGKDRLILFGTGVFSFLGQIFLTRAFQIEKAGYVSVMRTNDVTVAFILQFVVFGTEPFWTSIVGALLIVLSSVGINLRKWFARKNADGNQGDGNHGNEDDDDKEEEERLSVNNDHNYDDNEMQEAQGDE